MDTHPTTEGGRRLKRGDTFDPECHRMTHRLFVASSLLKSQGVEPTFPDHDEKCILHPSQRFNRIVGYSYRCECGIGTYPEPTWPEWVTGDVFDAAYRLADAIQTSRGGWHQSEASRAKMERERVSA